MNDNPNPQAIAPAKLRAPSDALPPFGTEARYADGLVYVTTTDPARMAAYRKLLRAEGSGWECIRVDTDDLGRQILWEFRGDERLLAPRARLRPAPANGFGAGNTRWKKTSPQPDPTSIKVKHDPALGWDELEEAIKKKQNQKIGANMPDPEPNPKDPWGGFVF